MSSSTRILPSIGLWVLVLGGVGFACGFFGPIALVPEANQGPLLGIFITGPGGALAGLVLGGLARALPLSPGQRRGTLAGVAAVYAAGILFFCLPQPELLAHVIDAEVRGCEAPDAAAEVAIREWDERIAKVTWSSPRKGWKQDVASMIRKDPGVVLDVYVTQSREVYENRKPWNRGTHFARAWRTVGESQRYFARHAGTSCGAYMQEGRQLYLPSSDTSNAWPPDVLPNFLGLQVLGALPAEYRELVVR